MTVGFLSTKTGNNETAETLLLTLGYQQGPSGFQKNDKERQQGNSTFIKRHENVGTPTVLHYELMYHLSSEKNRQNPRANWIV